MLKSRLSAIIARPSPGPLSMAVGATRGAAALAALRFAVGAFLAPYFHFFLLGALDAPIAHLPVVLDLGLRKLSVLPEDDVETEADHAEADKYQGCNEDFHP